MAFPISHNLGYALLRVCCNAKISRPSGCNSHFHCRYSGGRNQLEASFQGQECAALPSCSGNTLSPDFVLSRSQLQVEALITILYWPIHFYDRTLLVDPTVAPQLPLFADLGFHFIPTIVLMIDSLFCSPPWETHALAAFMSFSVLAGGYWIWVEQCFSRNNFYPYPLMGLMNRDGRFLLFGFATLLCWSSFLTLRGLYRIINGEIQAHREHPKKTL